MSDDKKKISFGFNKLVKKPSVVPAAQSKPATTVEYIKCVEDNNIQVLNKVKEEEKVLVIPMKSSASSSSSKQKIKSSPQENLPDEAKPQTLEELAAKEIVDEISNMKNEEEKSETFAVPLVSNPPSGEKESTLEDYENIPVEQYGLAMLRGMGWAPGKGIGKNAKIAPPVEQILRPKGMGLGADKAMKASQTVESENKDLKLCKGSYVRIISGANENSYGQVEGFIEESGRVIVKLARCGSLVIVGEFMLSLVTPEEYSKNSKVLNIAKYEKYKSDEKNPSESVGDESNPRCNKQSEYSRSGSHSHSSENSHRSRHENGSSSHRDERHRSRDDSNSDRHRNSSRRDYEDTRRHSDRRYEDRDRHQRKSSSSHKHKRDRSPRRD